jgi:ribosomal protein S18 acetylase RimI-like enzyme
MQNPTPPTTRRANPTDKEHITEMRLQLQRHVETSNPNIWHLTEEGKNKISQEVEDMLADERGTVLIAKQEGQPIGYIYGQISHRTHLTPGAVGFISGIYVKENHRRRGIGTTLVRELAKTFRAQGMEEVNLRYIVGNREATKFWTSLGLTPVITIANTPLEELEKRAQKPL